MHQYFALSGNGKVNAVLDTFTEEEDDAIVYKPFSKEHGLRGKDAIRSFLQVAALANSGLEKAIEFLFPEIKIGEERKTEDDIIIVTALLVTFSRGVSVKSRFEFHFMADLDSNNDNNNNYLGEAKKNNEGIDNMGYY